MLPIFIIAGPTASGKTKAAIDIVEYMAGKGIGSEIINADSIQLYKDLKILTAFPSVEEMKRVTHRLFGILSSNESYSVAKWKQRAETEIDRLHKQNKIPILCGGTGFYLKSIISGIADIPDIPETHRNYVFKRFQEIGREQFMKELLDLDSSCKLHVDDTQRILRSYEVVTFTGKPLSYWWSQNNNQKYQDIKSIVILPEREIQKTNILSRAVKMVEEGAIDEVKEFMDTHPEYHGPLDRVIGFIEIQNFLDQKITKDQLIERMFIRTRQYAKRQSTWFRHQMPTAKFVKNMNLEQIVDDLSFRY